MAGDPRIVLGPEARPASTARKPDPKGATRVLFLVGVLFVSAGAVDVAFALYPFDIPSPQWRFAHAAALITSWPGILVGLMALSVGALASDTRAKLLGSLVANLMGALLLAVCLIVLVADYGEARHTLQEALQATLAKSYLRALLVGLPYLACMAYVSLKLQARMRDDRDER